jgi:hypothetical protein
MKWPRAGLLKSITIREGFSAIEETVHIGFLVIISSIMSVLLYIEVGRVS